MRWLSFLNGFKLISVADFLDFGNGNFRSRLKAKSTLAADNDLELPIGSGTIALTSDIPAESAVGAALRVAADQAAARGAIDAEASSPPGAILRTTLTGVGLERRVSDGSVWLNGKIVQGSQLSPRELDSLQNGYVRNGGCNFPAVPDANGILRAENWPSVIAYPQKTPSGNYMLLATGSYNYLGTESLEYSYIPAGVGVEFVCVVATKAFVAGNTFFPAINQYDADKLPVNIDSVSVILSTASTLSAPLAVGDTTVKINKGNASQWGTGSYKHILLFPYKNSLGGIYPKPSDPDNNLCYSRHSGFLGAAAVVNTTATEYIITLPSPWAIANPEIGSGGIWPIGTECAESQGGDGNSVYPYGTFLDYAPNNGYKELRGVQVGLKSTQKPGIFKLSAGTQFVRPALAANYGPAGNETLFMMDLYHR